MAVQHATAHHLEEFAALPRRFFKNDAIHAINCRTWLYYRLSLPYDGVGL